MGDVNLEIKLSNLDERVIKIEETGGGSGGSDYITSVSNDFNVVNKKLSLSNDVTTKLSKVDDKIDKPASATDGQVLTYNGTSNEWEAKNPSVSITEPTDLEKGIIGGDEWVAQSYTKGATVIYNNKIYHCKADCSASNLPSEPDSIYWEKTSISALNSKLSNEIPIEIISGVAGVSENRSLYKNGMFILSCLLNLGSAATSYTLLASFGTNKDYIKFTPFLLMSDASSNIYPCFAEKNEGIKSRISLPAGTYRVYVVGLSG